MSHASPPVRRRRNRKRGQGRNDREKYAHKSPPVKIPEKTSR
jgi:hypothetical protein